MKTRIGIACTLAVLTGLLASSVAYGQAATRASRPALQAPSPAAPPHTVAIYGKDNAPAAPKIDDLPQKESLTMYGITWTFEKPVRVGQFVNGEYYIVGPATVTAIDPKPMLGPEVPADQIADWEKTYVKGGPFARNGSMLNMTARLPDGKTGNAVGFDSRIRHNKFDAKLFARLPIAMKPGDALVSTISLKRDERVARIDGEGAASEKVKPTVIAAVLTCLKEPVPADAFRPAFADRTQKIYLARDLRRELLPSVEKVTGTPDLERYVDMFQRPWTDVLMFTNSAPIRNMPQYGREVGRHVGIGALMLCLDYKPLEKERLLVNFVQVGVDLWGLVRAGHAGWPAFGGHCIGRKMPIVVSGWLLNDADMMDPYKKYPNIRFQEDQQTMYDDGWTGAKAVYAGHIGRDGGKKTPGWGAYENLTPDKWRANGGKEFGLGESYRRCCTSVAWVGQALAIHLMKIEEVWDHDAFLDYCDRWMYEDDTEFLKKMKEGTADPSAATTKAAAGLDMSQQWARQGQSWDEFPKDMWGKYRKAAGMPPTDGWKTKKPNNEQHLSVPKGGEAISADEK